KYVISPVVDEEPEGKEPIDRVEASFYRSPGAGDEAEARKDKVFILEHCWFEQEPFYTVVNPTDGKSVDVEPAIHKALQDRLEEGGYPPAKSVKRTKRIYKRAFIYGGDTLEEGDGPCPTMF